MGLEKFTIEFDNPSKSYFPGQNVTGKVIVGCNSEKKVQGLRIKFEGKTSVKWDEEVKETIGGGQEERSTTQSHEDSDVFFDYKYYAVGDERSEVAIPPGYHEYPFQFTLPPGLPSSFVGVHGKVVYEVQALMKRSWKFDHEVKVPFTVNAMVDLNMDSKAAEPAVLKKDKTICCFCCASGPVGYNIRLIKSGFVPGEWIDVEAELVNNSSRTVSGAKLSFVQTSTYYAKGKQNFGRKVLSEVSRPGVEPGDSDVWRGKLLQVPSVPPTKLGGCKLIDVQYNLHCEMAISGIAINLRGSVPIIIGTVPLTSSFEKLHPTEGIMNPYQPSAPSFPQYPNMPPPKYQDSVYFGPEKKQGTMIDNITDQVIDRVLPKKEEDFVPKYATYGWAIPQSSESA